MLATALAAPAAADPACERTPFARQLAPVLGLAGDSAVRGGKARVTLKLQRDDEERAVSADVVIHFRGSLNFSPPVIARCKVAPRLASTHAIGGELLDSTHLSLSVFVRTFPIAPLGVGDLASCEFNVKRNAVFGASPLLAEDTSLADASGRCIPLTTLDGQVIILTGLPPTPTPTSTPQEETPTSTPTVPDTATPIPSSTEAPTETPSPCAGDCSGDAAVTSDDLIRALNISLGQLPLTVCTAADMNDDGVVDIGELISAVHAALSGCRS